MLCLPARESKNIVSCAIVCVLLCCMTLHCHVEQTHRILQEFWTKTIFSIAEQMFQALEKMQLNGCVFVFQMLGVFLLLFFMSFLHIEIGELLYSWFSLNLVLRKGRMWSFVTIYLHITALY